MNWVSIGELRAPTLGRGLFLPSLPIHRVAPCMATRQTRGNDGVFASNREVAKAPVTLPDIFWTFMANLGLHTAHLPKLHGTNVIA